MIERILGKTWLHDLFNSRHEAAGSSIGGQFARADVQSSMSAEAQQQKDRQAMGDYRKTHVQVGERLRVYMARSAWSGVGREPSKEWIEGEVSRIEVNETQQQIARLSWLEKSRERSRWFNVATDRWERLGLQK